MFEKEVNDCIQELNEIGLLESVPSHTLFMHKPIAGENYWHADKKIFFVGQDANHIGSDLDDFDYEKKIKNIKEQHWAETFNFQDGKDNYLSWYFKYRYRFWEFILRFENLKNNDLNSIPDMQEILNNPILRNQYQSFGWANIGSIPFRHIYTKLTTDDKSKRLSNKKYRQLFDITQKYFGSFSILDKHFKPDVLIVLTPYLDESKFFKDYSFKKEFEDQKNFIVKYRVEESNTLVFKTFHPSGMAWKYNKKQVDFNIDGYVETIFNLLK